MGNLGGATTEIPELTDEQMARAIPARVRKRLILGQIESGGDVASLRRFVGLSQSQFAQAMGISVWTVHGHIKKIFERLSVRTRTEAVVRFLEK